MKTTTDSTESSPPNPFRQRQEQRRRNRWRSLGGKYTASVGIRCTLDPFEEFEIDRLRFPLDPTIQRSNRFEKPNHAFNPILFQFGVKTLMASIRDIYRSSDTLAAADLPAGVQAANLQPPAPPQTSESGHSGSQKSNEGTGCEVPF